MGLRQVPLNQGPHVGDRQQAREIKRTRQTP
jgi:hypothetical protein